MDPAPLLPVSLGLRCIPAPNPGIGRFSACVLAAMSFYECPEDEFVLLPQMVEGVYPIGETRTGAGLPAIP